MSATTRPSVGGPGRSLPPARPGQRGQATVELALALPIVVLVLLLVVQVALVARAQILVVNAAREGARAEAIRPGSGAAAARHGPGIASGRLRVDARPDGPDTVRVTVTYRAPTDVPLVGALVGDPDLHATVVMLAERDE